MAWEWSHTAEGIEGAYNNLHGMKRDWLAECFAEWQASRVNSNGNHYLRANRWEKNLAYAKGLPADVLADEIWRRAEEFRTCDNGGHTAWCCPYGCHTVSFGGD